MDSELTPRRKAEGVMTRWKSGLGVGEPGLIDAITTAIQKQSNEDLERHRANRAALEAELAAANERCAELAAGLDRLRKNALEMAGYVKSYGLDDAGPQGEWSRYIQCRSNIENGTDSAVILATVREKAATEEHLRVAARIAGPTCCDSDPVGMAVAAVREKAKREGKIEALEDAELTWRLLRGEPDAPGRFPGDEMAKYLKHRIAALEANG